jgi:hypothetical protein
MQALWSRLSLPPQIQFFIDLHHVISGFKLSHLHKSNYKVKGYDLGSVWKYINGQNLNKAYNSLINVEAQTNILINQKFTAFINRTTSIQTVDAIFSVSQQNNWKKELEPEQPVHSP